jgi:biopolymer transport protein ExbB
MKKLLALFAVMLMLGMASVNYVNAQSGEPQKAQTAVQQTSTAAASTVDQEAKIEGQSAHQAIRQKFIEGGPGFMASIILCLIFGLAISIERIFYLNFSTTNTKKLVKKVEEALEKDGVEAAKELCRNTRGPVASIFYQGLDRHDEGLDMVEKSIISYGGVQAGLLEKNLSWIGLFIALGPMLGFLGTVIGMVQAFDAIKVAGDISPSLVASGISVALITTIGGLIVAMILQVFYNYFLSKIDSIINDMEDSSIAFMDVLYKYNQKNK